MLLKLKCRRFRKKKWKKYFMILIPNPNPNLGIPTNGISNNEFQILRCIKRLKQGIKINRFQSRHLNPLI